MKKSFAIALVALFSGRAFGQDDAGTIKVRKNDTVEFILQVKTDSAFLVFANVSFYYEDKLLLKTSSGADGIIYCKALAPELEGKELKIKCSALGYKNSERTITIINNNLYEIQLLEEVSSLQTVTLTSSSTSIAPGKGQKQKVFLKK